MTTSTTERRESAAPDVVLSAFASEQRRAVLRILDHADEEAMEFCALVDHVAEHVRSGDGEPSEDEHRQRVRTALHHIHLPKLEACGMIVHDTETDLILNVPGELGQKLLALITPYEARE